MSNSNTPHLIAGPNNVGQQSGGCSKIDNYSNKMDKMIIPTISADILIAHIEDNDFFLTYGNPVQIVSDGNPDCVIISASFAMRLDELRQEIEKIPDCIAVMMSCEQYREYTKE